MAEDEDAEIASHQQVFDTAELLEQILLALPLKDLLLDQCVCKTWKNCVDNSIKLQRGLFFRPAGEMAVEEYEFDMRRFGFVLPRYETRYRVSTRVCFINPILVTKLGYDGIAHLIVGELDETELPSSLLHPQASWRRMLAIQPPLPAIMLEGPPDMVATRVDGCLAIWRGS
ncbi:hypothetical protein M409DRAFT_49073 [Zasmidium cellare ATCC 36951]|uniref:Uncharacterized protein n=1 Tax=Zasmidium cellare ATCC 36951 TaxID=1080233 RepID=A0A6A6D466_ZASCE|nr:uncharacterized protein M409DRAFT_49073 [Zasmidium cellare ATCC 36951]KAF2174214.1 hypothetical protein M409DRAFT_49073 [Zasmidium cellare ATCC 36951]